MADASTTSTKHRNPSVSQSGSLPLSPLGATPRPPLPQRFLIQNTFPFENHFNGKEKETIVFSRTPPPQATAAGRIAKSIILVILIFGSAVLLLRGVYLIFPQFDPEDAEFVKYPQNIEDAKTLGRVLSRYTKDHFTRVLAAYFITYIFLQTFAIPGSIFLSVISGFLFPFPLALFFVCLSSAVGASNCYLLSVLVGKPIIQHFLPERLASWKNRVELHRDNLLYYIIFLRITPFLPNWFINIASPVINIPLSYFFLGTFVGVAPPSVVAIQGGTMLHQLTSASEVTSYWSMLFLILTACLSLLPVIFKDRLRRKFD